MFTYGKALILSSLSVFLVACGSGGGGGGGGGGGPVASTNAFNLQTGYVSVIQNGWSKTFAITGTCSGSLTLTRGAATTSTTFESANAISGTSVVTLTLSNCVPASSASTETNYYDTNYVPLGYSILGGNYAVYASTPTLPTTVHVGDAGVIGTLNRYTNSSKSTSAGHQDESYVIEADTASTAIVNLITKTYDSFGALTATEQNRYRINSNNTLTPISLDVTYSSGTHLVGN